MLPTIDRREFLSHGVAAALGALVMTACGDGLSGSPTGPSNVTVTINLADYAALGTVGGIAVLSGTSTPIAVVRSATGYRAFSLVCPHQGTTVGLSGAGFLCPNHRATFASTGAWTGGQRTSSLFEFTVAENTVAGSLTITS